MLCFFCKQKTAYEMLIRDWSSDVCSSDLTPAAFRPARGGGGDGGLARQPARQLCDGTGGERRRRHRPRPALGKGTGTMTVTKVTARLAEWITGLDAAAIPAEIGRASCRERVCPYV